MSRRLPSLLTEAKAEADSYRVKRSERGFNVWRFWDWNTDCGGWQIIVRDAKSREDAEAHVIKRLWRDEEEPPAPLPVVMYSFYDFGTI